MTWAEQYNRFDYGPDRQWNRHQSWLAECHVAARYGLPEPPYPSRKTAKGWDIRIRDVAGRWLWIDVKWSANPGSPLRLNATVKPASLVYVLVTGVDEKTIRGFTWRRTLLAAPIEFSGVRRAYTLPQSELHPNLDVLFAANGILPV